MTDIKYLEEQTGVRFDNDDLFKCASCKFREQDLLKQPCLDCPDDNFSICIKPSHCYRIKLRVRIWNAIKAIYRFLKFWILIAITATIIIASILYTIDAFDSEYHEVNYESEVK